MMEWTSTKSMLNVQNSIENRKKSMLNVKNSIENTRKLSLVQNLSTNSDSDQCIGAIVFAVAS